VSAYRCIVADPPWLERGSGKSKRGADRVGRVGRYLETKDGWDHYEAECRRVSQPKLITIEEVEAE
jgi:hypothetical protein